MYVNVRKGMMEVNYMQFQEMVVNGQCQPIRIAYFVDKHYLTAELKVVKDFTILVLIAI